MDNPQGSPNAAWIAGLWLADGTFVMSKRERKYRSGSEKSHTSYAPTIVLAMQDHPVIERAYEVLREAGIGAWMGRRSSGPGKKDLWQVGVRSWGKAAKMIEWIAPHLVGRKLVVATLLHTVAIDTLEGPKHYGPDGQYFREWVRQATQLANSGREPSETIMAAPPPQVDEEIVRALREI